MLGESGSGGSELFTFSSLPSLCPVITHAYIPNLVFTLVPEDSLNHQLSIYTTLIPKSD
jgi:hypothetical protein